MKERIQANSLKTKIELGQFMGLLFAQYITYLCAYIALTVATGIYLWKVEVPNGNDYQCNAPTSSGSNDKINVSTRFN